MYIVVICHPSSGHMKNLKSCCAALYGIGLFCYEGQGDCFHSSQCSGDLKCGKDNCVTSFPGFDDCCYDPKNRMFLNLLHFGNIFY